MSNKARRLIVEEFFHCYRPIETVQSKGMYSFMPRSSLQRLVCDTPDSNRNQKSRYFFMEGDEWMCHPGDQECMPIDKTQGIMPLSGMHPFVFRFLIALALLVTLTISYCSLGLSKIHTRTVKFIGKKNSTKPRYQRGRGLNQSTWILSTGIVTNYNPQQLYIATTVKFANVSPSPNTLVSFFAFKLSNSLYLSTFVQKWKIARGRPTSSNKQLQRKNKRRVNSLRGRVRPTRPPRGNRQRRLTVSQKSLK